MFLKRIEISGFKSFANSVNFDFLPNCSLNENNRSGCGITGIVGPNGSGKSNVSDAVRWVMGEQSMKNLRGKKSEDVIFSGSEKKGKMSMAKVSLIFDNADKKIPVEFNEVIITRKLYRNGESEYLINDSKVRLLDVVDILAQSGISRESYCVVGQGMTDAILNATPQDRRGMIEDAAGVKHFQIKKIRSLKKLEKTKENLKRTSELIKEVEPHLNSLHRQAKKAEKSKGVHEELKKLQQNYFYFMWNNFSSEKIRLEEKKNQVGIDMKNYERAIDDLNEKITAESKRVDNSNKSEEFETRKKDLYQTLRELEKKVAVAEGHIEIYKERIAQEKKVKIIPVDLIYVQKKLEVIRGDQNSAILDLEKVEDLAEISQISAKMKEISQSIENLQGDARRRRVEVLNTEGAEKVKFYEENIAKLEAEILEQGKSCQEIKTAIDNVNAEMSKAMAEDKEARMKFFELERQVRGKQQELDLVRNKFNEIKIELAKIGVREEDLVAEVRQELGIELFDLEKKLVENFSSNNLENSNGEEIEENSESVDLNLFDNSLESSQNNLENLETNSSVNLNSVDFKTIFETEMKSFDRVAIETKINKLKSEYDQIGGIDPMVIDEYKEMQERFNLLINESKDLEEAIEQLKEVIKEIDKKIHDSFVGAFKQINEEFTKYFRILFNGGNAKLLKINVEKVAPKNEGENLNYSNNSNSSDENDEENEEFLTEENLQSSGKTEIGIEISATPPNKKLRHLSLLSGGERTLTSIAMLFAIVSFNPPPFIILDEVEAALDEANSRRLAKIFAELSSKTQFIIITHNRETMRHSDVLYGVTMGNDGISQVLSVKLEQIGEAKI